MLDLVRGRQRYLKGNISFHGQNIVKVHDPCGCLRKGSLAQQSAITIISLWPGIGAQLLASSCCGRGLMVSYCHHLAVVKGWWSAIDIILLWSGAGGQL